MEKCKEFFDKLLSIISRVSQHARSLIYDVDSNIVEQFHSIVAKFVGGKRINYSKGRSYESRCFGAVLSFNSKSQMNYVTHKTICGKSPSKFKKN
jgi:formyltetrahydrofolate synthetase